MYLKRIGIIMFVSALSFFLSVASQQAIGEEKAAQGETFTNSLGMKFVLIPAGTFMMGSPSDELGRLKDELQHKVTITKSFYLQSTEVTQRQWREIMSNNPSHFKDCGDNCPVERVSWDDAQEFIVKLNQREGTDKYRLPTEAEWEYPCRAGSTTRFCFGDDETTLGEHAWYHDNSGFGINLISEGGQYILALVWWNGEIRDDVGGTFIANYTLNQWTEIVIYFDLNLGWMVDIDGDRIGAGYSLPFYGSFTGNAERIWMTSFVSGGGNGYFRVDDISAYGSVDSFLLIIIIIVVVIAIIAVISVVLILVLRKRRK